jgi:endonuclease/exonuclease/phosphatase family metal-dependent hydrolase
MILVTWNLQWCRGMDGRVDPERAVAHARSLGDFDVLCLQEVASGFPDLPGSAGEDQFTLLETLVPGFTAVAGVATDHLGAAGVRRRFGNLLLSRLPVLAAFRHLLPWPVDAGATGMQRVAVEAVLAAPWGPVRITTTHLEYYSPAQRAAQVERLRALHAEACAHAAAFHGTEEEEKGPFRRVPRSRAAILCGDFNFRPDAPEYLRLQASPGAGMPAYRDAWTLAHPDVPHRATFRVDETGAEGYCCDFVFVTEDLADRVERVAIDGETRVSDHQPVVVELRD